VKLYRTRNGNYIEDNGSYYKLAATWDDLIAHDDLLGHVTTLVKQSTRATDFSETAILAPIENQEVWASGVTYYRSRNARMEESKDAGGGDFYDRVYTAERPELFFKSIGHRVVGTGDQVRIRRDATWSVPEPEMTLVINPKGRIIGFTAGNDMSSRDIEGENPLYLPQAKVYDGSCALGPCVYLSNDLLPASTTIQIEILRNSQPAFTGATSLAELKRNPYSLVEYLYRETDFAYGALLMTGTGIVPPDSFTLASGDQIHITIQHIGTLKNTVA
jgi:2-dehydro-3-deoxy-D-arabinonate dehydratase